MSLLWIENTSSDLKSRILWAVSITRPELTSLFSQSHNYFLTEANELMQSVRVVLNSLQNN